MSDTFSAEELDALFRQRDLANAELGRFDKIMNQDLRRVCRDVHPSLIHRFEDTGKAHEEYQKQMRVSKGTRKAREDEMERIRGLSGEDDIRRNMFFERVKQKGFTKMDIFRMFESINSWLPKRYDHILARAEGCKNSSKDPFSRLRVQFTAGGLASRARLNGALFNELEETETGESDEDLRSIQELEELNHTEWQDEEDGYDENGRKKMTVQEHKERFIQSKVMVDINRVCGQKCNVECIDDRYFLYGCLDHGLVHICLSSASSCLAGIPNKDRQIVCAFSGAVIDWTFYRTRSAGSKKKSYSISCEVDSNLMKEKSKLSALEEQYVRSLASQAQRLAQSRSKDVIEYVKVDDKDMNAAMVESAIRSGENCVVAPLAAQIIVEKLFVTNDDTLEEEKQTQSKNIGEEIQWMSQRLSSGGLLNPRLDDHEYASLVSGATDKMAHAIKNSKGIIPSEDYLVSGDTFVSSEMLRERASGVELKPNSVYSETQEIVSRDPSSRSSVLCDSPLRSSPRSSGSSPSTPIHECSKTASYAINAYSGVQGRVGSWHRLFRGDTPQNISTPTHARRFSSPRSRMVSGTPLRTPRSAEEIEVMKRFEEGGVVMKPRKKGRNSLVRSMPEMDSHSITRGSRPGRTKKKTSFYQENLLSIYDPSPSATSGMKKRDGIKKPSEFVRPIARMRKSMPASPSGSSSLLKKVLERNKEIRQSKSGVEVEEEEEEEADEDEEERKTEEKPSIEVHKEQYFLVKGERTSKNRNLHALTLRRRNRLLKEWQKKKSKKEEHSVPEEASGHPPAENREKEEASASDVVLMGSIADVLLGSHSIDSLRNIMVSEAINTVPRKEEEDNVQREMTQEANEDIHRMESALNNSGIDILGSKRTRSRDLLRQKKREAVSPSLEKNERPFVRSEVNSFEFRKKMERMMQWIEQQSVVFSSDRSQYIRNIETVMDDLIFCQEKRKNMKMANRIIAQFSAQTAIQARACEMNRDTRSLIEERTRIEKRKRKREKKKESSKLEGIEAGGSTTTTTTTTVVHNVLGQGSTTTTTTSTTQILPSAVGKKRRRETELLNRHRKKMMLGKLDDCYANKIREGDIEVIQRDQQKIRKYSHKIYCLWRLLLTTTGSISMRNPKAQFDHFVLGVLYILSETDIVLCGEVIIRKDEWLKRALPRVKTLCENFTNKLYKPKVVAALERKTLRRVESMNFSTPNRVYSTRIITRGKTRVNTLLKMFDQEIAEADSLREEEGNRVTVCDKEEMAPIIEADMIRYYLTKDSHIEFIPLAKTSGNIRRAAVVRRRRKGLFEG